MCEGGESQKGRLEGRGREQGVLGGECMYENSGTIVAGKTGRCCFPELGAAAVMSTPACLGTESVSDM